MRPPLRSGEFRIRTLNRRDNGFRYQTYQVVGYLHGERVRKKFKRREDAVDEASRLEAKASSAAGTLQVATTRLSGSQLADAEAAFLRLGSAHSLSSAVEWFLANYRPPSVEKLLADAVPAFLEVKRLEVRPPMLADYKKTLTTALEAYPNRFTHTLTTEELEKLIGQFGPSKKSWNNQRGNLHAFFEFCLSPQRKWATENPVKPIRKFEIARGLPAVETAEKIAELFEFLESYTGENQLKPAGFLVPYFALATFAGIRPSIRDGEIRKIAESENLKRIIDTRLGVIRITPEIAKTNDLRQVTIQPNLAAWLQRYPLEKYPLVPSHAEYHIGALRKRFDLSADVLRHTFISMHVAKFRSLGDAALQAGNSEAIIKKHYLNMVTVDEAEAFWQIRPKLAEMVATPVIAA